MDISKALPQIISSDPTRLRQVLINLIGNAFKFTEKGTINLQVVAVKNKEVQCDENESFIKFSIIDSGIGISKEKNEELFGAFNQADSSNTRKFGGTGLGLSISKSLAELMGGEMGIISTPNVGSAIWFTIINRTNKHLSQVRPEASTNATHNAITMGFKGKQILVAEDNTVNQMVIKGMIKKLGASVTIANDGKEALDAYKHSLDAHNGIIYDLVLMDYEMPILDGASATKKIRALESNYNSSNSKPIHIPIIAITAHAMNEHRDECLQSGMDHYLRKPIDIETLQEMFIRYLD